MIGRLVEAWTAGAQLAAAREDASVRLRELAAQCAKTDAAERRVLTQATQLAQQRTLIDALNQEARDLLAEVHKLRGERDALAKALDNSRDIAAGYAADLAEAKRAGLRALPAVGDLRTAPAADLDEVARLRGELERTKQALAAATDRLAEYRDREEVAGRG